MMKPKKCGCCHKEKFVGTQTKGGDWLCRECYIAIRERILGLLGGAKNLLKVLADLEPDE